MSGKIKIGLVGAGMFGGDVHLRTYAGLQRFGIAPQLARIGMEQWARDFAPVTFELAAVATRSEKSARRASDEFHTWTGRRPAIFFGDEPWGEMLEKIPDLDIVAVATPDHLHTKVILAALNRGAHVITEKPMCLVTQEADEILRVASAQNRIVAVDMHKRYDPDHLRVRDQITRQIGEPLYGSAFLEEPLEVSASTFKWAASSDPFTYVGSHWVDLFWHYYHSKPASLTAVGQKKRLVRHGIDAFDAVQARVDYANGMSVYFHNNWITPGDFEGPVNQGHEIAGTLGKVESDQQYRGLRYWFEGGGSRTANTHFTRAVTRSDGTEGFVGYGVDSLTAGVCAICRAKFLEHSRETLAATYPNAEDARIVTAIIHAAKEVRELNFKYLQSGRGAIVSASFGPDGITVVDGYRNGPDRSFKIYDKAV
jgi:predicted dehydrogenase